MGRLRTMYEVLISSILLVSIVIWTTFHHSTPSAEKLFGRGSAKARIYLSRIYLSRPPTCWTLWLWNDVTVALELWTALGKVHTILDHASRIHDKRFEAEKTGRAEATADSDAQFSAGHLRSVLILVLPTLDRD